MRECFGLDALAPLVAFSVGLGACHGDCSEHLFKGLRHCKNEETLCRISVVFSTFVDDSEQAVSFRLGVRNDLI